MSQPSGSLESLFARLHEELRQWRAAYPDATLDEIAAQVTPRRRHLMGALWAELAVQEGNGYAVEGLCCEQCGRPLVYRGTAEREVLLLEAEMALVRAYYHCAHCEEVFFPLDRRLVIDRPILYHIVTARSLPGHDRPVFTTDDRPVFTTHGRPILTSGEGRALQAWVAEPHTPRLLRRPAAARSSPGKPGPVGREMRAHQRQGWALALVRRKGVVVSAAIADRFGVSRATGRADLERLACRGLLVPHGRGRHRHYRLPP